MRSNAQKILLILYSSLAAERIMMTAQQLKTVVPDLTDGGFRSTLLYLERKHWLLKEQAVNNTYLSITDAGRRALIAKFPALNEDWDTWEGNWQAMVFLEAPAGDKQFRYLRDLLKAEHALPLSRGLYLAAQQFSSKVMQECADRYQQSVIIFSVGEWQLGELRPIVTSYYDLTSLAAVYSSIGKTVDSLLSKISDQKKLSDQQKSQLSSVHDRLVSCLTDDPGLIRFYFPGLAGVHQILPKLQKLILL